MLGGEILRLSETREDYSAIMGANVLSFRAKREETGFEFRYGASRMAGVENAQRQI